MRLCKNNRLLRFYGFLKGKWILNYFFGLISSSSQSFITVFIASMGVKWMADAISEGSMGSLINGALFFFFGLLGAMTIIPLFWVLFYRSSLEIKRNVLYAMYDNVYRLPQSYIESHHSGDLISRLTNDIETSEKALNWSMKRVFLNMGMTAGGNLIYSLSRIGLFIIGGVLILRGGIPCFPD